jgi:hypothetical protein
LSPLNYVQRINPNANCCSLAPPIRVISDDPASAAPLPV